MRRSTRNSASGPLQSLPYPGDLKRKSRPVTEEESVPVAEEEDAATGHTEFAATQEIGEFNIPVVNRQDSKSSSVPLSRPRKRARASTLEVPGDDVVETASTRKATKLVTRLDETRSPAGAPASRRSTRKSLLGDNVAGGAQKAAGKPRLGVRANKNRSSLAMTEAREEGLAEETERRIEEGIPSEDEEGGGARLSASHDPLQLKEKQPANRRTTLPPLRTEQAPSGSEGVDGDPLLSNGSQESPGDVVEELMNSVVTGTITQIDETEEQEAEDLESEGSDVGFGSGDNEDVDEAIRHQLSTEADSRANNEVKVQPQSVTSGADDSQCEESLVTAFKAKLNRSREVLQTFNEQLKAATDTVDLLMELRTGIDCHSGYTRILQAIIGKLGEEEYPDNSTLEELADFALNINTIVSETRDAHRNVKALLEELDVGIVSGTSSARTIETMLEQKGFKEKEPPDGINWGRINRNLVVQENEVLIFAKTKPTDSQTPRRSARSNPSRYRTQGAPPTPEARPPPPPPAIPSPHSPLSDPEPLESTAPVIGDDAPVEVVRIESFGSRPSHTPRRSKRRHETEDDDSPQVREDRAWSSPELKALFRRLAQVQKAEPGKIIVLDSRSGYPRTKEEILTKAKEIKEDMVRSGRAGSLKPTWDDI
ncbi:unnamed protein product [Tuber aestivum]|uniref:Uncharacterized protein n=1 Tax=Tuber aestivum TaxID=59557 RepID=A0A292Q049_9PEZI|nr:unnamed protein product [Tuber aestivum]